MDSDPVSTKLATIDSVFPRSASQTPKHYMIDSGKIMRVTNFMGVIRFRFDPDDENGRYDECLFFLNSYSLKRVRTLCQVFTVGDWVGFVAAKMEGGHWTALDIRPRSGIMQSVGEFHRAIKMVDAYFVGANDANIRAQCRRPFGGGDIAFSRRVFKKSGWKDFAHLEDGDWVRFLAMEKPEHMPKGECSAVAIEAELPFLLGLVVKRHKGSMDVWCMEVGLVTSDVSPDFPSKVGDWVRFRLAPQPTGQGNWRAADLITTSAPSEISVKVGRYLRVTALVVGGVLSSRFGTVWSDKLGRMNIWRWCLKNVGIRSFQRLTVRAFFNGDDERRYNTDGDAWTVYEINSAAPFNPKLPTSFASPTSSILRNAHAVVEEACMTPRKWYATSMLPPCYWRLWNQRFGRIIAYPSDVVPIEREDGVILLTLLRPGDNVRVSFVPVSWGRTDEYRAFVVEKVCQSQNE